VYTDFYEERNLTTDADKVEAAVLYAQGFEDFNVKPSQALNWFNALDTEKKGIFGHWGHTTPERADWNDLTLAWFDEHLKGTDTGVTNNEPGNNYLTIYDGAGNVMGRIEGSAGLSAGGVNFSSGSGDFAEMLVKQHPNERLTGGDGFLRHVWHAVDRIRNGNPVPVNRRPFLKVVGQLDPAYVTFLNA
jgi:hypothetical protein